MRNGERERSRFIGLMAAAARVTIAEVGAVVPAGELEPESVQAPRPLVDPFLPRR